MNATAKLTSPTAAGSPSSRRSRALTAPCTGNPAPADTPSSSQPGVARPAARRSRTTAAMPANSARGTDDQRRCQRPARHLK
jgi:hypothetical protein